ncbi:MAG: hypothetical protein V2A74_08960 [bacterium]
MLFVAAMAVGENLFYTSILTNHYLDQVLAIPRDIGFRREFRKEIADAKTLVREKLSASPPLGFASLGYIVSYKDLSPDAKDRLRDFNYQLMQGRHDLHLNALGDFYFNLGLYYLDRKEDLSAAAFFGIACHRAPELVAETHQILKQTDAPLCDLELAAQDFRFLDLVPGEFQASPLTFFLLARIQDLSGQSDEAEKLYRKLLDDTASPAALLLLGRESEIKRIPQLRAGQAKEYKGFPGGEIISLADTYQFIRFSAKSPADQDGFVTIESRVDALQEQVGALLKITNLNDKSEQYLYVAQTEYLPCIVPVHFQKGITTFEIKYLNQFTQVVEDPSGDHAKDQTFKRNALLHRIFATSGKEVLEIYP